MSRSLGVLTLDLIAKTGNFDQGMDRASRRVRTTANEMEAARRAADRLVAGIAAAAAGFATAAAAMAVSSAKALDATSKMAQQIGTTTESLTGMRFAAQQFANISDQQFDMSMRRMTRRIAEAAEGSGSAKAALEAMGLSARELARLSPDQQMLAIADAMQKTERQADRLRYTMALFDTEGMALVPALQQGAEAFEANIALARQFGAVVSQEAAAAAEEFMTNMNLLNEAQKGFKIQLAESILPMLADFTGHLVELSKNAGDMADRVETALKVVGVAAAATATIITSRLVASIGKKTAAWTLATAAAARHQAQMTSLAAAISGANRVTAAGAAAAAASMTTLGRGAQLALGVLGGGWGLAAMAAITGAAFLAMGRDSKTAATDVDELTRSLENLNRRQLESAAFNLENELVELSKQAEGHGQILQGLRNDYDALSKSQGVTEGELRNVRQAIRDEEEAFESVIATIAKKSPLLAQITQRLWDLDTASRGAAGGVDTLNRAMGFSEAGEKYLAQIQGRIKALQDAGDPIKIASRYIAEHTELTEADRVAIMSAAHAEKALIAARDAAAKATKAGTNAINEAKRAAEAFRREQDQGLRAQFQAVSAIHQQAGALEDQVLLFGQSKTALEDLTIARLEEQAAMLRGFDGSQEQVEAIEREIEARKRLRTAIGSLEQKEAERQAWEDWARDVEQIFDRVGQSLTDAIFDGGKSGKELLKDVFKGLTFNILINPVMGAMQGWVTNQLGGLFGVQNPAQGGGILGTAQNLYSGYNAITGGLNSTFGNAAQWLGQKVGSEALTSFGLGLSGTTAATGIASIGAGLGASLGTTIGTSAATMASTSFAASMTGGAIIPGLGVGAAGGGVGAGIGAAAGSAAAGGAAAGGAAGFGAAVGAALPWIGGALAIGSLIGGGLFDREPTTRREQRTQVEYADGLLDITKRDDRVQAGADVAVAQMTAAAIDSANSLFQSIGIDATIESFRSIMASSHKRDRDGVASGGTLRVGDQLIDFGITDDTNPTLGGFGGWSSVDPMQRIGTEIQLSMLEALKAVSDELPSVLSSMLEVDIRGLDEAGAADLVARFTALTEGASAFLAAIEQMPFDYLRDVSFDAAANMIQLAGGLDNLLASQQTYYERFYSDAERHGHAVDQLTQALAGVGVEMPALVGSTDDMLASYRALVESQDLTTEAGQQAYVTLMQTAGAFADVAEFAGQAAVEAARYAEQVLREREGLERQLLSVMGDTAAIRALELAALDESNRALQERIWAIQDEKDAIAVAEARAADAAAHAAEVAQERYGLETQLLQLMGDTDALRARQLATLDESNHALQRRIWALQDEAQAARDAERAAKELADEQKRLRDLAIGAGESAYRALSTAVEAERARIQKQSDRIAKSLGDAIASASDAVNRLEALSGQLSSTVSSMVRSGLDEGRNRSWAQERVSRALSVAKLTGVMPEGPDFEEALRIVAEPSEGLYSSFEDYQADFLRTAHEVDALRLLADDQLTTERRTLKTLEDQLAHSQSWYDSEMARLDQTLEHWRDQLDIAAGTYQATLSVADAVVGVASAVQGVHSAVNGLRSVLAPDDPVGASYMSGTGYVPHDMTANIHRGEIIIDPRSSDVLRRYGINVQGGGNTAALERKVEALQREQERTNRLLEAIATNSKRTADDAGRIADGEATLKVGVDGPVGAVIVEDWTVEA